VGVRQRLGNRKPFEGHPNEEKSSRLNAQDARGDQEGRTNGIREAAQKVLKRIRSRRNKGQKKETELGLHPGIPRRRQKVE